MGKIYSQGIVSPKGFDLSTAEPVDQRTIVKYYTDLVTLDKCYPGIEVSIEELQYNKYKLIAIPSSLLSNWVTVESGIGPKGDKGDQGDPGLDGESAYELYVDNGGTLTEVDWLLSLHGEDGTNGINGIGVPLGGTTGQSLVKNSATNYDTKWEDVVAETVKPNISNYNYHQSLQIDFPYVNVEASSKIESGFDDAALGGIHASIYVEELGKYFVFTRSASTKVYVYDDINDFSNRTIIDISSIGYASGVETAVYNKKAGKIFFGLSDATYSTVNTLVKSIEVDTNIVATVIDYDTGIVPGALVVVSIGDFIYTAEGNYGFKYNKFDINGNFISSIANGMSGVVGAHGWAIDEDAFYITSFINYNDQTWAAKIDLATFTVVDSFDYSLPGADLGLGTGAFTNQLTINNQYLYCPTEDLDHNYLYKINKNDLSDFTAIDVLKTNIDSDLYFAQVFDGNIYYGGVDNTFGFVNEESGENVLLENPFPFSLNQVTTTRDQLLVAGFDLYPVSSTGYVGKGRYFKVLQNTGTTDYLPLTAGSGKALTGALYGTGAIFSNTVAGADAVLDTEFITKLQFDTIPSVGMTFTNKILKDLSNDIHANAVHFKVRATEDILKGQPVIITGFNSGADRLDVALADNTTGVATGLAEEDLLTGTTGAMLPTGLLEGFDTSAFTEGTILYVGNGVLVSTEPTTGFAQPIAYVLRSHLTNGAVQVNADYPKQAANDVRYDNATSGLTAIDVQAAIDEIISGSVNRLDWNYSLDDTQYLITMNSNPYFHNYTPSIGTGEAWFRNLFIGENAGNFTMDATAGNAMASIGIGASSLNSITTGHENVGVGTETLRLTTTGEMNTAVGSAALYSNVAGLRNTAVGRQAGVWMTSGSNNTFLGSTAGFAQVGGGSLTTIDQATFVGSWVDGTEGSTNEIAIGYQANGAGSNTVTLGNTSIIDTYLRGIVHTPSIDLVHTNTIGQGSITKETKSFINDFTLNPTWQTVDWARNLFIGLNAGGTTLSSTGNLGIINTAVGNDALVSLTDGIQNNMFGSEAGTSITTGNSNQGFGDTALFALIDGSNNVAIAKNVLANITTGDYNIAIGRNAGYYAGAGTATQLTEANNHILIGVGTAPSANITTGEIVIGYEATGKGSNTAVIGGSTITRISAGVDYTAVDDEDLVTKGFADLNYLGGSSLPVADTTSIVEGSVDATKQLRFEVDGLTTATTRVITMPDNDVDLGEVGSVIKVGTPASGEVAYWTGDGTLGRDSIFTYVGTTLDINLGAVANNAFTVTNASAAPVIELGIDAGIKPYLKVNTVPGGEAIILDGDGNGSFTGLLTADGTPIVDADIGNRGYNDARYAQVGEINTWTAQNNFEGNIGRGDATAVNINTIYTYAGQTGLTTQSLSDGTHFLEQYNNLATFKRNDLFVAFPSLTDAKINAQGADSAITKGYADANYGGSFLPLVAGAGSPLTGAIYGGLYSTDTEATDIDRKITEIIPNLLTKYEIEIGSGSNFFVESIALGGGALATGVGIEAIAIGKDALKSNVANKEIVGIGNRALSNNTGTGTSLALGTNAGNNNSGFNVELFGSYSGEDNDGDWVTFVGSSAGRLNTGHNAVGVGSSALHRNDGNGNTAIGHQAAYHASNRLALTNTTSLGANTYPDANNQVILGDANVTSIKTMNTSYTPATDDDLVNKGYSDGAYYSGISMSGGLNASGTKDAFSIQGHELLRVAVVTEETSSFTITPFTTTAWSNYNSMRVCNSASAMTVTLEQHAGFTNRSYKVNFVQKGAGNVTFAAGTGVTIISNGTTPKTTAVGDVVIAMWISTTEVVISGDLD